MPPSQRPCQRDQARLERHTLLTCKIGRVACAAQQALHLARPVFLFDLDQRLQLTQMVGIAQSVQHAGHLVIRPSSGSCTITMPVTFASRLPRLGEVR